MFSLLWRISLFLCVFSETFASTSSKKIRLVDIPLQNGVYVLSDDTFDIVQKGSWFVDFHIPSCGHCQTLSPIWDALGKKMRDSKVKIAKLDCSINISTRDRLELQRFPTIKLIRGGKLYSYTGERTIESFERFIREDWLTHLSASSQTPPIPLPPPVQKFDLSVRKDIELSTSTFYPELLNSAIPWAVCFYAIAELDLLSTFWKELAHKTDDKFSVGSINLDQHPEIGKELGINVYPEYAFVHKNKAYLFDGVPKLEIVKSWVLGGIEKDSPQSDVERIIDLSPFLSKVIPTPVPANELF